MERAELNMNSVTARCIPKKKNILADQLSHSDQILPTEWSSLPWLFNTICEAFGWPLIDMFATRANAELPLHVSPVRDPMGWKHDALQHQ